MDEENLRIIKRQVKTRLTPRVPIYMHPAALAILDRWRGRNRRFVFNFLEAGFDLSDEEALYRRRISVTRTVNTSLKRVGEKLGHSTIKTTEKVYARHLDYKAKADYDECMGKIFGE